jgi:lipoprotein-releasing system permease protein
MENSLDNRLSIPVDSIIMQRFLCRNREPESSIKKKIFITKDILVTGVFPGKDQLDNYIIAPIELLKNY